MSILVNENTRLLVQGLTGREGTFHALRCIEYGTTLVAGVTPGRGGTVWEEKVPVFNAVNQAVSETRAGIGRYFEFYNARRPHSSLDRMTPDQFYFKLLPAPVAA